MCFGQVMYTEYVQEKKELIQEILKDRKTLQLPKITQVFASLIIISVLKLKLI